VKRAHNANEARLQLYEELDKGELTLADASRRLRRIIGKSQDAYAQLIGIAPRVLKDFERGVGNPTLRTLEKIGRPLGLEVAFRRRRGSDRSA
jgi:transcriptional regulator with XRE-family HTH domain